MEYQRATICSKLGNLQANPFLKERSLSECSFGKTVNKELVHRAAVSEVFLTDANRIGEDRFYTGAHLPRTHSYYNDDPSKTHHENIVLLEVCRQSSIIVSHNYYDAPLDAKFIFNEAKFHIENNEALLVKSTPSYVLTEVEVISKEERNGKINGLTFEMRIYVDGKLAATKLMDITWLNKVIWNKVRSKALKFAEAFSDITFTRKDNLHALTHVIGRTNVENVVLHSVEIRNGKYVSGIRVNKSHPAMFDHPLDHVPGMLLIEAFRQMAFYVANRKYDLRFADIYMKICEINFTKFTEFNPIAYCFVDSVYLDDKSGDISLELSVTQNDELTALCHIKIARK
ncbi:hypothetical protein NTH31_000707 [Vibrio mimicus]